MEAQIAWERMETRYKAQAAAREVSDPWAEKAAHIIRRGDEAEHGYEVAFLDEALADVREADRRHKVDHTYMVGCRRLETEVQAVVDQIKAAQD